MLLSAGFLSTRVMAFGGLVSLIVLLNCFFLNGVVLDEVSSYHDHLSFVQQLPSEFFYHIGKDGGQKTLCRRHMDEVLHSINKKELWAFELIDAWGKVPSGILWGHTIAIGAFEECLNTTKDFDDGPRLQGKYCLMKLKVDTSQKNGSKVITPPAGDGKIAIQTGICVPNSCSAVEIQDMLTELARKYLNQNLNETLSVENSCKVKESVEFRTIDWVALMLFCVFGVIILCCSVYDYVINKRGESGNPLFLSFSIFSNGSKLFQMKRTTSPDVIECLHGIRSLSIIWVVFGHTYLVAAAGPTINATSMFEWAQSAHSMLIQSATVSVDSFLLMSGLLVAWVMIKELEGRGGSLNIPLIYLHRYLRLTPLLAVCILFSVSLAQYCGFGPFWHLTDVLLMKSCREHWWTALLYVQNYVNPDSICLGHTWYLSVDMQLFIFAPFIMMCLHKWGWKVFIGLVTLILLSVGCTFATFMNNDFSLLFVTMTNNSSKRNELLYFPTHTRMSPWLVGIFLGYHLYKTKHMNTNLPKKLAVVMWLAAFVVMGAILFGPYGKTQPGATETKLEGAFYESLSRVSWSIALALVIYLCHTGHGGLINSMLSAPFWQPISRLSYSIYLTHLPIQTIIISSLKTDTHFSDFDVIYRFWADFTFTVMISIIATLAFESPIIGIEKIIFSRKKTKPSENILNRNNAASNNV